MQATKSTNTNKI